MTTKKAIEIASRVYGLYLLIQIPFALAGLISVFAIKQDEFLKNPLLYKIWAFIHPVFYLIVAILLISKAEKISNFIAGKSKENSKAGEGLSNFSQLSFWLILLGVYFFITSTSSLIRDFFRFPISSGDSFIWSILLSHGFNIIVGILLITKTEWIESKINKDKFER
ncbi:hypothetical protein K8R33_00910 [archaeon]|nr:hypothetical protein [archaeon]